MKDILEMHNEIITEEETCVYCGRRFNAETMYPISLNPLSSLECGRDDCDMINI